MTPGTATVDFGGAASHAASPDDVTIDIRVSAVFPTIGDSLTVFCTVTSPERYIVGEPSTVRIDPYLDIDQGWKTSKKLDSNRVEDRYRFLAYVLSPDTLTVGPFAVEYATADGDTGSVTSNTVTLIIRGVIAESDSTAPPMPNRGPFQIASRGIPLWLILLIAVISVLLAWSIVYLIRKRKAGEPSAPTPKPIDEIEEFVKIKKLNLNEKGRTRELYILVSDAMRAFLHRNMRFDAMYETSEEILSNLSRDTVDDTTFTKLREIFGESDMVKFAKFLPPAAHSATIVDRALVPVKTILELQKREQERLAAEQEKKTAAENKSAPADATTGEPGGEKDDV